MLILIEQLKDNKLNSNVMTDETREKLKSNIKDQGGFYPPIIVRKIGEVPTDFDKENTVGDPSGYRIVDGHNRSRALRDLGYKEVECVVWNIDDTKELLLLATLNELKGTQDPTKRAELLETIIDLGVDRSNLLKFIPEDIRRLDFILSIVENRDSNITDPVERKNADIESERRVLTEKFISQGYDPEKAAAMADINSFKGYVPKSKNFEEGKKVGLRPLLVFFFDTKEDFDKACKYFEAENEKNPNTKKLLDLIK